MAPGRVPDRCRGPRPTMSLRAPRSSRLAQSALPGYPISASSNRGPARPLSPVRIAAWTHVKSSSAGRCVTARLSSQTSITVRAGTTVNVGDFLPSTHPGLLKSPSFISGRRWMTAQEPPAGSGNDSEHYEQGDRTDLHLASLAGRSGCRGPPPQRRWNALGHGVRVQRPIAPDPTVRLRRLVGRPFWVGSSPPAVENPAQVRHGSGVPVAARPRRPADSDRAPTTDGDGASSGERSEPEIDWAAVGVEGVRYTERSGEGPSARHSPTATVMPFGIVVGRFNAVVRARR